MKFKLFNTQTALCFAVSALIRAQLRQSDYLTLAEKANLEQAKKLMDEIWEEDSV